jgi:hypothetical protein
MGNVREMLEMCERCVGVRCWGKNVKACVGTCDEMDDIVEPPTNASEK